MASEILMPRQGQSVESCIIIEWKKEVGDLINEGDVLCEVETDKAAFEVESTTKGILLAILHEADADVEVLKPIAVIGEKDEDISAWVKSFKPSAEVKKEEVETTKKTEKDETNKQKSSTSKTKINNQEFISSPRARKASAKEGIDIESIEGTGPHGRIIEKDILSEMERLGSKKIIKKTSSEDSIEVKVKGIRKLIADRMMDSLHNTAQLTINASADARSILRFRELCKQPDRDKKFGRISINDSVMYAALKALVDFPEFNAHFLDNRIIQYKNINLGFAVDTPRGLMVPVIKEANTLSLSDLSAEAKRLASHCIDGTINPDDLTGGTFTITNLGSMGIESFTPVLNTPEVAILGVCAVQIKPILKGTEVEFIPHLGLSLTFDHCANDGAPAARFISNLREKISNIELTLLETLY